MDGTYYPGDCMDLPEEICYPEEYRYGDCLAGGMMQCNFYDGEDLEIYSSCDF
jgi:hypothetical protein